MSMEANIGKRLIILVVCNFLAIFLLVHSAWAGREEKFMRKGMSFSDVLELKGPPIEKQEQESRRHEIWYYGDAKLVFVQGRLKQWKYLLGETAKLVQDRPYRGPIEAVPVATVAIEKPEPPKSTRDHDKKITGLLNEIMSALPSE